MRDIGGLFTDREAALAAVQHLLDGGGRTRVLVFTGVSGMGKSTLLARIAARPEGGLRVRLVDAEGLRAGMAAYTEGGEEAALELLRQVGAALAASAPWWRRRWVRQQAEAIGIPRAWTVRVSQWAGRGAVISHSPVTVTAGTLTQGERRAGWVRDLLTVARAVRRRCALLIDTCEWLLYFDDTHAEQPRQGRPLGVGSWFAIVLEQILDQVPGLRVVLAGTALADAWRSDDSGRYEVHELRPWQSADTRAYLARRGLPTAGGKALAETITAHSRGLPAEVSWIADALTGALLDNASPADSAAQPAALQDEADLADLTRGERHEWLRTHVLGRISERNRHLLYAAAVLDVFTPQALHTVAFSPASLPTAGNDEWFEPFRRMSCVLPLPGPGGQWQLHRTIRDWLLTALAEDDARRMPDQRTLPRLHTTAADYHEALADGAFSIPAAHHRFALGDDRHTPAWTQHAVHALSREPADHLTLRLLTDAVLSAPTACTTLPELCADAHLIGAHLALTRGNHTAAHTHAVHALTAYQHTSGHPGIRVAALLAGQAAWHRSRYPDAATHWTTAQDTPASHGPDPAAADLHAALAEAVLNTGDLVRADALLDQALHLAETSPREDRPPAGPGNPPTAVCDAVPIPPLADAVPARLRQAHLHHLTAETAARLCQWNRCTAHANLAFQHGDSDPRLTAHAHRLLAERALFDWDLATAEHHVTAGLTAARRCPDQRCMIHLQLTRANLADHKAVWAPLKATTSAGPSTAPVAPRTPPSPTASLSLTARAEAAHQHTLAQQARTAACELATELQDPRILAHAHTHNNPAEALRLHRAVGDRHGQANALSILAYTALDRGDLQVAEEHGTEALRLHRALGNRHGQANALNSLAATARDRGDLQGAEEHGTEALRLHRAVGDRYGQANSLNSLAATAWARGDLQGAEEHGTEALRLHRAVGDRYGQAIALYGLADTARDRGETERARALFGEAAAGFDQIGASHAAEICRARLREL